eukprot:3679023-Amphidinium_carterae.1
MLAGVAACVFRHSSVSVKGLSCKVGGEDFVFPVRKEISHSATNFRVAEGTHHYMSPERLEGTPHANAPPADIYAFAMVMVKCLTGALRLPGHSTSALVCGVDTAWLVRVMNDERPDLPADTRDMAVYERSIRQCWMSEPTERPTGLEVAKLHLTRLKQLRHPESTEAAAM